MWHCDRLGRYSLYGAGVTNQNYLRGTQEADASGNVTFTSIFPGCYSGRWPHIHFEVYSEPLGGGQRLEQGRDVADCATQGGVRHRLRDRPATKRA